VSRARRKTPSRLRPLVAALVVLGVFLVGIAVGAALGGDPEPATTTYERTLRFATVTVTEP
jgi:uncharacterized membrane protein